jgi:hypothetical protein
MMSGSYHVFPIAIVKKKYACAICGEEFSRFTTLRDREEIHEAERPRPFVCIFFVPDGLFERLTSQNTSPLTPQRENMPAEYKAPRTHIVRRDTFRKAILTGIINGRYSYNDET